MTRFEVQECWKGRTLIDPITQQAMHSRIGPESEAQSIYLEPSGLHERLQISDKGPLVLWDVGMGLAANSALAWQLAHHSSCQRLLQIHSFENQLAGLRQALANLSSFEFLSDSSRDLHQLLDAGSVRSPPGHHWTLHPGDFQTFLEKAQRGQIQFSEPELIYWDFYDPKSCPDLWSLELFEALSQVAPTARLDTYSAATPVRVALALAGFYVGRKRSQPSSKPADTTPGLTPMKSEGTVALGRLCSEDERRSLIEPLNERWLEKLERSSAFRPYGHSEWSRTASREALLKRMRSLKAFATADEPR
ncbi:MAG: hypothetical protein RJB38_1021 [Pseudomonadota bacterium]|jgi:tRNA U34 5-methylaminomethyl-2-thiouridine-forming methyltransferase MnmC